MHFLYVKESSHTLQRKKRIKGKKEPFEWFQRLCSGAKEPARREAWNSLGRLSASRPHKWDSISNLLSVLKYGLRGACLHFVLILT